MARRAYDPLAGWGVGAVLLRFLLSAFFGFVLGLVLALASHWLVWGGRGAATLLWCLLVALPLTAGVAGVFWFEDVVDGLRQFVEAVCSRWWWLHPE
jgi:hypothetical protein